MDEQNFKMSVFGGFSKKSVVDYITKIVDDFNLEIENLKKDYGKQIEEKEEQISELSKQLKISDDEVKRLREKIVEFDNEKKINDENNLKKIEEKDAMISKMTEEIEELKAGTAYIKNENKVLESKVNKAKDAVKEHFNKIIEQARAKMAEEYKKNLECSKQEGKVIRRTAADEAIQILNNSASAAHKIISETKDRIKKFVDLAKQEAKEIIEVASDMGQKIVKKSAETILDERKNVAVDKLTSNFSSEDNSSFEANIDNELFNAVKKLNTDFNLEEKIQDTDKSTELKAKVVPVHSKNKDAKKA